MRAGLNAESTVMVVQVLVDETNCVAARNKIMRCRRAETRNERMREWPGGKEEKEEKKGKLGGFEWATEFDWDRRAVTAVKM